MWKGIIYDPWVITIGGALVVSIITWIIGKIYSRWKKKEKKTTDTRINNDEEKTSIEYVALLVLIIDEESRDNINFLQLGKVVREVYKEKGYEASVSSYSRATGRLEIKRGMRKEVISPLIGKIVQEFKIKSIRLLN